MRGGIEAQVELRENKCECRKLGTQIARGSKL